MNKNDKIVRDHHVKQALLKAIRTQRECTLPHGLGNIRVGSLFDCNRQDFEKLLTSYWDRLFVGWNPFKAEGRGCWQVWQRPIAKAELNDMEHWVADIPYLTPKFITRLKEMDSWEHRAKTGLSLVESADRKNDEWTELAEKKEDELIHNAVKDHKSQFNKLKGLAQDGYNPFWFLSDKAQGKGEA